MNYFFSDFIAYGSSTLWRPSQTGSPNHLCIHDFSNFDRFVCRTFCLKVLCNFQKRLSSEWNVSSILSH